MQFAFKTRMPDIKPITASIERRTGFKLEAITGEVIVCRHDFDTPESSASWQAVLSAEIYRQTGQVPQLLVREDHSLVFVPVSNK